MRTTYVYRKDKSGNVRGIPTNQRMRHQSGEDGKTFEERIMRTMYDEECKLGSRFRVPAGDGRDYSKTALKDIWTSERINRETEANTRNMERAERAALA